MLDLVGDMGGFSDAIFILAGILVKQYNSALFQASISEQIPVSTKYKGDAKEMYSLKAKVARGEEVKLSAAGCQDLENQLKLNYLDALGFLSIMVGFCGLLCCRKSRAGLKYRQMNSASEKFERSLDIRRQVKTEIDLKLFLSSFMSPE